MIPSRAHTVWANSAVLAVASALLIGLVQGCGPANSLTPDKSRAQVVDAAKEIVATLKLPVESAYF